MKVLRATQGQYNALNKVKRNNAMLQFKQDGNGQWVVDVHVLDDPAFDNVKPDLNSLQEIDWVPPVEIV